MKGLEIAQRENGFTHVKLHYSAHPDRDPATAVGKAWYRRERPKYDKRRWDTEMELSRETYSGHGVYSEDFNEDIHVLRTPYEPDLEFPLLCGWDFGGNQSCIVTQFLENRLYVVCEYPNMGWNSRTVVPRVIELRNLRFGSRTQFIDFMDPTGKDSGRNDATGVSNLDVMLEYCLDARPAHTNDPTKRIDAVLKRLTRLDRGIPGMVFNAECKVTIQGMRGSYRYKEKIQANQKKPSIEKNEYSHIQDGLQYVAVELDNLHLYRVGAPSGVRKPGRRYKFSSL